MEALSCLFIYLFMLYINVYVMKVFTYGLYIRTVFSWFTKTGLKMCLIRE